MDTRYFYSLLDHIKYTHTHTHTLTHSHWEREQQNIFVWCLGNGLPCGTSGKEPSCQCWICKRCGFDPWVGKIPWRREWRPLHYFCLTIPWTEKSGRLQSTGSRRIRHSWSDLACRHAQCHLIHLFLWLCSSGFTQWEGGRSGELSLGNLQLTRVQMRQKTPWQNIQPSVI